MKRVNKKRFCSRVVFKLYPPKAINRCETMAGLLTYFRVLNAFPKPIFELLSEASASLVGKQERVLVAKGDLFST